jgi:LytS/YehU family sensor histidine kinase
MAAHEGGNRAMTAYQKRILGINFIATGAVMATQGVFVRPVTWPALLEVFLTSALFCNVIGGMIATILPRLPFLDRLRFPLNWLTLVAVLLGINAVGCGISLIVLVTLGRVPLNELFGNWVGTLRFGMFFTLLFGVAGTLYEGLRSDLERTTLALRTKERDEAEARRAALEAQLASLESRVQPHFLFNTLNSIAALVHDDPAGAERMTGQLGALLRSSLDDRATPLVRLDEELRIVTAYLDIERVRFGERLRYDIVVDSAVASTSVPRLSLQTLVENSVKYAVSARREGSTITVRAARIGDRIRVGVQDDGPGFDAAVPEGHGLSLIRSRLAMLFGERAWLTIDSRPGGTIVTMDLPADQPSAPASSELRP